MHHHLRTQTLKALIALTAFPLLSFTPLQASIVADFTAGNTTEEVDGWEGKAGDGWANAWSITGNNTVVRNAEVRSTAPLYSGGGNYLTASHSITSYAGGRASRVSREYGNYGGVSLSAAHSLSFYYRLDAGLADMSTDSRVQIFNATASLGGPDSSTNWEIRNNGGNWWFGGIAPSGSNNYVSSTVELFEGDVYFFELDFDPVNGRYSARVTNLHHAENDRAGDASSYFEDLYLTNMGDSSTMANFLNFALRTVTASEESATLEFSLDGISIVPEPGIAVLALGGVAFLWVIGRRFSR